MSNPTWHRFMGDTLILEVRAQPRSDQSQVVGIQTGKLKVHVTAAPVGNARNAELRKPLGKEFGVAHSRVRVLSGECRRDKRIAIVRPQRLPEWLNIYSEQ